MKSKILLPAINASVGTDERYLIMITKSDFLQMREMGFTLDNYFFDRKTGGGCQRDQKNYNTRTSEIAQVVQSGTQIDTSGLLNILPPDNIKFISLTGSLGHVELYSDVKIQMVDSRNRVGGFMHALNANPDECPDFKWQAVLTNRDDLSCKKSFVIGNGTPEPIKTNLLIWEKARLAESLSPEALKSMPKKLRSGVKLLPEACSTVELLNDSNDGEFSNNILYKRISLPNEPVEHYHSIMDGGRFANYVRRALVNRSGNFPTNRRDTALVFSNMFEAWSNLVPKAALNYKWFLFREHCGSIMICELVFKLMSMSKYRGRVPTVLEFEEELKNATPYCDEAAWNPDNAMGVKIHGIDAANDLANQVAHKIDPMRFPQHKGQMQANAELANCNCAADTV